MKLKKGLSTVQLLTLGLLISLLCASVAQAAPLYRGKFTLPYAVRWGEAVLPAGEYQLKFSEVQGTSALLIANDGDQRVVHSLRLAELDEVFIFEPALARGVGGVREARTM